MVLNHILSLDCDQSDEMTVIGEFEFNRPNNHNTGPNNRNRNSKLPTTPTLPPSCQPLSKNNFIPPPPDLIHFAQGEDQFPFQVGHFTTPGTNAHHVPRFYPVTVSGDSTSVPQTPQFGTLPPTYENAALLPSVFNLPTPMGISNQHLDYTSSNHHRHHGNNDYGFDQAQIPYDNCINDQVLAPNPLFSSASLTQHQSFHFDSNNNSNVPLFGNQGQNGLGMLNFDGIYGNNSNFQSGGNFPQQQLNFTSSFSLPTSQLTANSSVGAQQQQAPQQPQQPPQQSQQQQYQDDHHHNEVYFYNPNNDQHQHSPTHLTSPPSGPNSPTLGAMVPGVSSNQQTSFGSVQVDESQQPMSMCDGNDVTTQPIFTVPATQPRAATKKPVAKKADAKDKYGSEVVSPAVKGKNGGAKKAVDDDGDDHDQDHLDSLHLQPRTRRHVRSASVDATKVMMVDDMVDLTPDPANLVKVPSNSSTTGSAVLTQPATRAAVSPNSTGKNQKDSEASAAAAATATTTPRRSTRAAVVVEKESASTTKSAPTPKKQQPVQITDEDESADEWDDRQKYREKNRISAQKSRQRKKDQQMKEQSDFERTKDENFQLKLKVTQLEEQVKMLNQLLGKPNQQGNKK